MKYSIITVNYNNKEGLRRTIESVIHQTYRDFEYIVIDGGSTDDSAEVLKEYDKDIDYWVSEPDGGIYQGMNKGIRKAQGEYLNFMNSGDCFYDNDILIGLFAKRYIQLPWRFHLRLGWARTYGENELERAIYHYVDRDYSFNPANSLHALFLHYLSQSPWGEGAIRNSFYAAKSVSLQRIQDRMARIRLINNASRMKKRVFMGLKVDEERLRADFGLGADEVFQPLEPGRKVCLPCSIETHFYLVFWSNYREVRGILECAGLKEYVHFADGTLLMPERAEDMFLDDRSVIWGM